MPTLHKRIIFVSDEDWADVRRAARDLNISMSAVMRHAIDKTVPTTEARDALLAGLRARVEALPGMVVTEYYAEPDRVDRRAVLAILGADEEDLFAEPRT